MGLVDKFNRIENMIENDNKRMEELAINVFFHISENIPKSVLDFSVGINERNKPLKLFVLIRVKKEVRSELPGFIDEADEYYAWETVINKYLSRVIENNDDIEVVLCGLTTEKYIEIKRL